MRAHEQFAEDLAIYSLGALEGKAKCALELHLDSCEFCQNELRQLQREVALLALSVVGPFLLAAQVAQQCLVTPEKSALTFSTESQCAANPLHLQHGVVRDSQGFCGQGCGYTPTRWQSGAPGHPCATKVNSPISSLTGIYPRLVSTLT